MSDDVAKNKDEQSNKRSCERKCLLWTCLIILSAVTVYYPSVYHTESLKNVSRYISEEISSILEFRKLYEWNRDTVSNTYINYDVWSSSTECTPYVFHYDV